MKAYSTVSLNKITILIEEWQKERIAPVKELTLPQLKLMAGFIIASLVFHLSGKNHILVKQSNHVDIRTVINAKQIHGRLVMVVWTEVLTTKNM